MIKILSIAILLMNTGLVFSNKNTCMSKIDGYKLVENSIYPFWISKEPACFFAFYTKNHEPTASPKGNGNLGDTIWYGYYKKNNPNKIYKFPKPSRDTWWELACNLRAVSFLDMNGDGISDVTVISACDKQNTINYNFPFVFIRQGNKFVLDKNSYYNLNGTIALSIADIRAYIAAPKSYYKFFNERYQINK